ncbi:DNA-binding transcriptional regulator EnvR [Halomonas elongata]|uniref:DNA-binding transcriptional regulator EnvR n=2 Tax=Halomonas elongata TaxID=2746 RepID=A0A1B8NUL1_HALEL|nr:DNA-binding transcriptional regulator EnvR [Halomonas elongata]
MASECLDALLIYLRKARDQGLLREDLSPENATRLLQATLSGLFHDWLRDPEAFSLYKYGTQLVDIQLRLFERDSASS